MGGWVFVRVFVSAALMLMLGKHARGRAQG